MKNEEMITALGRLGYPLFVTEEKKLGRTQIYGVLRQLAGSSDSRLVEAFPVVLANCAHEGIELKANDLWLSYSERSEKKKRLERLLLASADLLSQEGLEVPRGIGDITEGLRLKYGNLLAEEKIVIGKGILLSLDRLRTTLRRYATDLEKAESAREKEKRRQFRSFQLNLHLSTLFPPKQKELILKKLNGDPLGNNRARILFTLFAVNPQESGASRVATSPHSLARWFYLDPIASRYVI